MGKKKQIGYSLIVWETLKEYNEETKWYEPTKNKKVEVTQLLSEELSDNEDVKSMLLDKLFGYKDNIKEILKNNEFTEIPDYHKESLEKDQKISELESKLAELEQENRELHTAINLSIPNQIAMKDEIERLHTCIDKRISELVDENDNLKQQLAEKDAEIRVAYAFRKQKCDNLQKALAEKDEQLQQAIEMINNPDTLFYQQQELIDNLTVQLAEKDKFLKKQKELFETVDKELYLTKDTLKHHTNIYKSLVENKNQDKISFVVEQLRQLKIDLNARRGEYYTEKGYKKFACSVDIINTIIDNQIKQLKEKK